MATQTFVQTIEKAFEKRQTDSEPKTLAEAVSNELMQTMPRISPELFERKRKAKVSLSKEQTKKLDEHFGLAVENFVFPDSIEVSGGSIPGFMPHSGCYDVTRLADAKINTFAYAFSPEQSEVVWEKAAQPVYVANVSVEIEQDSKRPFRFGKSWSTKDVKSEGIFRKLKIKTDVVWKSPIKLDVGVEVPQVPRSFAEMGDEAMALYFDHLRTAPRKLRSTTSLKAPKIGVLWFPINKSLYCLGKIPEPKRIPRPAKGDPALILDIPDGKESYRHVVAVWDIGKEEPFQNWIREYTEGSVQNIKGMERR